MYHHLTFEHEKGLEINELIERAKVYHPDLDSTLLKKSYNFAHHAHRGQKRSSGEDYIIHPINVAAILVRLKMDQETIVAGLLHDVVEDCEVPIEEIREQFGTQVATIVDGMTKISKIKFKSTVQSQAENFRKMILAMAKDVRVIIVKVADRMHNMRTLQYVSEEKQKKIAQETLDIYIPLTGRLGIHSVKSDLEDLCLRFLHPDIYFRLAEKMSSKKDARDSYINSVIKIIQDKLSEYSVKVVVTGRTKHFYSIYKKMMSRGSGV